MPKVNRLATLMALNKRGFLSVFYSVILEIVLQIAVIYNFQTELL